MNELCKQVWTRHLLLLLHRGAYILDIRPSQEQLQSHPVPPLARPLTRHVPFASFLLDDEDCGEKRKEERGGGETAAAAPVAVLVTQKAFWKKPKLRLKCHRKVSSLEAAPGQQLSPITPRVHVAGPRNVHVRCCAEMIKSSNRYEKCLKAVHNKLSNLRAILPRPAPNAKCAQPPKIEKAKRSLSLCVYKEASF